jgi:LAO/AO transport system kinase
MADCTVLVTMPGGGDAIQTLKAGVMEIGDIFVVNKADRDGALRTQRELNVMLRMNDREVRPPVLLTTAETGAGVAEVVQRIEDFAAAQRDSGQLEQRRLRSLEHEVMELIGVQARQATVAALGAASLAAFTAELRARRMDPATVAAKALAQVSRGLGDLLEQPEDEG